MEVTNAMILDFVGQLYSQKPDFVDEVSIGIAMWFHLSPSPQPQPSASASALASVSATAAAAFQPHHQPTRAGWLT